MEFGVCFVTCEGVILLHSRIFVLDHFDWWCKNHFLSDSCTTTSVTPVVTSSIQSPPCVKLDTAQEKSSTLLTRPVVKSSGRWMMLSSSS
ncbi:uncharacterized protein LOC142775603 isoform X3 [Rhipicephalus microplus]|uniref:uncharacterized protein LOC142775603 isoform X3 n=1 Tax=Rhipicephalus microplus TaxID=6941 RepID=UPI003F6C6462